MKKPKHGQKMKSQRIYKIFSKSSLTSFETCSKSFFVAFLSFFEISSKIIAKNSFFMHFFILPFLVFPLFLVVGCASKEEIIPISKVVEIKAPKHLTNPTPVPAWNGTTNQDLIEYVIELKEALNMCNADKGKIGEL